MKITREDAISIAKSSAFIMREDHEYIPMDYDEMANWMPHEWVILAIERAAEYGS